MKRCLIAGTGPAALMAADILSQAGMPVTLFERRAAPGWKLLVAGSSGLNVSYECEDLAPHYTRRSKELQTVFQRFGCSEWLDHLHGLGEETFVGTSRRHFLVKKKASSLLSSWTRRLSGAGAVFCYGEELSGFASHGAEVEARFCSGRTETGGSLLLALGGASWEEELPAWPGIFQAKGIAFTPFAPANAGWSFEAPPDFFARAEGNPIKGMKLQTSKGEKTGECMITRYGLEGTPVYTVGAAGPGIVDLKPDLSRERLEARLAAAKPRQRLSAARLSDGARLLAEALFPGLEQMSAKDMAAALKALPLRLIAPRPLSESISSSGGVSWDELGPGLELKKEPGVFCAGEMVDWDAPTGGFLLQASVSMGAVAAWGILSRQGSVLRPASRPFPPPAG